MRRSRQHTSGGPHGWTVGLDGLTDVTKWAVGQCMIAYDCLCGTYVVVVGLAPAPPPRGVVVVTLVVLLDEEEDEEELEEVRGSSGSSNAELDEEEDEAELARAVPVGWPLVRIALHVRG